MFERATGSLFARLGLTALEVLCPLLLIGVVKIDDRSRVSKWEYLRARTAMYV